MTDELAKREDTTSIPLNQVPFTWKTLYAIAKTEFVPRALRGKPNALLAAILTGREMGLGPMESMRSIDVIDGRPSPSVEWMVGRILEAGHLIYPTTQTAEKCTMKGIRFVETPNGEVREIEQEFTFTMAMAERAGLASKNNWQNYPEAMLYWRAAAQLARQLFPDILRSVKHTADELGADGIHPYGVVQDLPDVPEELEMPDEEPTLVDEETGEEVEAEAEVIDIHEADEREGEWNPEATGQADETAIARVKQYADEADLFTDLIDTVTGYDEWITKRVVDIEEQVRFICRGLEAVNIWKVDNALRYELSRAQHNHLSEFDKKGLQKFARNVVAKAMVALKENANE